MATLALILYAVYLVLAFGLRMLIQVRRTGSTGFHGLAGPPGSAEWFAGIGFTVALLVGAAAPVLALLDLVEPISALDASPAHVAGVVLAVAGIATTFYAQVAMGASWRIGVDPVERTQLVTTGPFALVRNPIYAAMLPTALGLTLLVPSWVSFAGLAGLVIALELQVRVVEEPYLLRAHGEAYAGYAERVGRFFPGIGRLPRAASTPVACSLGGGDLEQRLAAIAEIGAASLISRNVEGGRHLLRFRSSAETRQRLEEIVAAEAECCSFLELSLAEEGSDLVLLVSAPEDGQAVADGLARAFAAS